MRAVRSFCCFIRAGALARLARHGWLATRASLVSGWGWSILLIAMGGSLSLFITCLGSTSRSGFLTSSTVISNIHAASSKFPTF